MMRLMWHLFNRVKSLSVVLVLNSIIDLLEVLVDGGREVNWIVYSEIVYIQVCHINLLIPVDEVLKEVPAHDSQ